VEVYVWNDLSPADGCSLVGFMLAASSVGEVAKVVRVAAPLAQNKTPGRLLRSGHIRKAAPGERELGLSNPGVVFWRDDAEAWRRLS